MLRRPRSMTERFHVVKPLSRMRPQREVLQSGTTICSRRLQPSENEPREASMNRSTPRRSAWPMEWAGELMLVLVAVMFVAQAHAQQPQSTACDRAGSQAAIPADRNAAPLLLEGKVFHADGRTPAAGILVYAHHTGADGLYDNGPDGAPRREAFMRTDASGWFQLRTGRPAPYPNRTQPAHIHLHLWGRRCTASMDRRRVVRG